MRWLDQLQEASFRGVKFWVDSATEYVGRDKVVRDYPFKDASTVQDMGGVTKPGSFPAYVAGDDVFEQRDALKRAFNKIGPGDLVLPWLGLARVEILGPIAMRYSTAEGGVVRFDVEYLLATDQQYPQATRNTARMVRASILAARLKAIEDFANKFSVKNLAGWAMGSSLGAVTGAIDDIKGTLDTLISIPAGYLAAADTQFRLFSNVAADLLPGKLGSGLMDLMAGLSDFSLPGTSSGSSAGTQREVLNGTLQRHQQLFIWSSNYDPSPFNTPTRQQESANHTALEILIQTGSVLAAAETISQTDFTQSWNYTEAMQWRATLNTEFQRLLSVVDSSVYQDLLQTMAAVSDDIVTRSKHLGRISTIRTPHIALPATVVSYKHYGTIDHADEIIANNNIQHPLFIDADSVLKVVAHE